MNIGNLLATMIYTIGHSTRPIERYIAALKAHGVTLVADVRSIPRSRWFPQYNQTALERALAKEEIRYVHLPELGGKRTVPIDDKRTILEVFAAHMKTKGYKRDIDSLIEFSSDNVMCIMCSEKDPKKCHRALISDTLVAQGEEVTHIIDEHIAIPHWNQ